MFRLPMLMCLDVFRWKICPVTLLSLWIQKKLVVPDEAWYLLYNGKEMRNVETLSGFGLTDGDLVLANEVKAKAIAFDEVNKSPE
ncbi:DNA damage-inducible protein 1 [Tanacetum coccineum]